LDAERRAPGSVVRKARAFRAEWRKAVRQPSLYVYLVLVVLVSASWGLLQYSLEKEKEAKRRPAPVTDSFPGEEPEPEPVAPASPEERGANGFLVLAAALRAGSVLAAVLLLLYASSVLAGERTLGTCRLVLTRPITRWDLVFAKAALLFVVVLVFVAAIAATGTLVGAARGGYGDYIDVRHGLVVRHAAELVRVTAAALLLTPLALLAVAALGLLVSSLFASAATAVTVSALAALTGVALNLVLSPDAAALNLFTYVTRQPAILESYATGLSEYQFGVNLLLPGVLVPAGSALVFLLGTLIMFRSRDIHE
jgi:ABC-type transport system involved in multi-copper enzyme maturation permease subunit